MPIYPGHHCSICGENPNLVYICDECHQIFCEDCIDIRVEQNFVCFGCGSINIQTDKHGSLYCKECHNEDVRSSKKIIPTCRNCGGETINRIEEKQQEMLEKYKKVINNTRQFLEPLEEEALRLHQMRSMLIQLREDAPQCFHYINLESELLTGFKLFENGKSSIYERVNQFFKEVQRNIHYITEIFITHPENLTYIAEVIKLFEREHEKVVRASVNVADSMKDKFNVIEEKINFMDSVQNLFNGFIGKFTMDEDEKCIFGIKCKLSAGSHQNQDINKKNGTILITSKRMYFFHEQGVFKKRTVLLFSVELSDLQHVQVKGRLKKKVSLDFVKSMYQFSLTKEGREELVAWIEKASEFNQINQIDEVSYRKVYKFKFHLKAFREELENAIYKLIGFQGSTQASTGATTTANQIVNAPLYRTSRLPLSPILNKVNQPPRGYSNPTQGLNPNYNVNSGFSGDVPEETRFNSNYGNTHKTPHGHYGYPHDNLGHLGNNRGNIPRPARNIHNPQTMRGGMQGQNPGYSDQFNNYPSEPTFGNPPAFNAGERGYGMNSQPSFPSTGNRRSNPSMGPVHDEYRTRQELVLLQQDEFALGQTLRALEQKFDSGYLNNPDFVKSYKELQREKFRIQTRIEALQKYIADNLDFMSN